MELDALKSEGEIGQWVTGDGPTQPMDTDHSVVAYSSSPNTVDNRLGVDSPQASDGNAPHLLDLVLKMTKTALRLDWWQRGFDGLKPCPIRALCFEAT